MYRYPSPEPSILEETYLVSSITWSRNKADRVWSWFSWLVQKKRKSKSSRKTNIEILEIRGGCELRPHYYH